MDTKCHELEVDLLLEIAWTSEQRYCEREEEIKNEYYSCFSCSNETNIGSI